MSFPETLKRVRDWLFTVPFLLLFGLALVFFDLAGRLARVVSLRWFEATMAMLQRTLVWIFRICGTHLDIERSPLIRPRTAYAVISNHQSMFDIALIGGLLFSNYPKYVAKKELGRLIPSISLNLRHGGNALIDRGDRTQSLAAISAMASRAQERGVSVVIFPEGTRSRDGSLGPFRPAGAEAMLEAAPTMPVVPTSVDGSWRLAAHNLLPVPFGTRVRIRFGDPIPRDDDDSALRLDEARRAIDETLSSWRAG